MPTFDVVSRTDMAEVDNALQGAGREIATRYDFKGSVCSIERKDQVLTIRADDEYKRGQVEDLLRQKFKVWKFVRFGSKPAVCNTLK